MMDITSKYRHRRTTGGGKRWRKRNAHTERHELKSGTDTSMRNVRGANNGGMYPGSFWAGIYARNAAGNGKGAGKMIRCFLILTLAFMIKVASVCSIAGCRHHNGHSVDCINNSDSSIRYTK